MQMMQNCGTQKYAMSMIKIRPGDEWYNAVDGKISAYEITKGTGIVIHIYIYISKLDS